MENDLIYRKDAYESLLNGMVMTGYQSRALDCIAEYSIPAVDAVPWEFLERYADWFCAIVSMPEFVREAKAFYYDTYKAMEGGHIGE